MLAFIVDGLIVTVAFAILWLIFSGESYVDYWQSDDFGGGEFLEMLMSLLYYTILIGTWATTAGKRLFGLYVVRTDGSKVGLGRALARHLAYYLSFITLGIGFLMIALRADKRGLHDLVCDTVVIQRTGRKP